ncbi:hypothetical protein GobsT_33530 [Gemmata obscuriglobus]|nr:hypothetical protein GobsT_33530 [Gemmata obscuriglobus]VTS06692.1 unnamed protein product [Gemmata obscuriglobus UQM 2246]
MSVSTGATSGAKSGAPPECPGSVMEDDAERENPFENVAFRESPTGYTLTISGLSATGP